MINVEFKTNKYGLILNAIKITYDMRKRMEHSSFEKFFNKYEKDLTPFLNKVEGHRFSLVSLLDEYFNPLPDTKEELSLLLKDINSNDRYGINLPESNLNSFVTILEDISKTQEFNLLLKETEIYRDEVRERFNGANATVSDYLKEVVGEEQVEIAENTPTTVIIMAPRLNNGSTNLETGAITWGNTASKQDPFYDITFLTHEILHSKILPYKYKEWEIGGQKYSENQEKNLHALIQFITDKELHSRLSGENYSSTGSHENLKGIMQEMYPYWLAYLYRNEENPYEHITKNMLENPEYSAIKGENGELASKYSSTKIAQYSQIIKSYSPYDFIKQDFSKGKEKFSLYEPVKSDKIKDKDEYDRRIIVY